MQKIEQIENTMDGQKVQEGMSSLEERMQKMVK